MWFGDLCKSHGRDKTVVLIKTPNLSRIVCGIILNRSRVTACVRACVCEVV